MVGHVRRPTVVVVVVVVPVAILAQGRVGLRSHSFPWAGWPRDSLADHDGPAPRCDSCCAPRLRLPPSQAGGGALPLPPGHAAPPQGAWRLEPPCTWRPHVAPGARGLAALAGPAWHATGHSSLRPEAGAVPDGPSGTGATGDLGGLSPAVPRAISPRRRP
jgi:hypothetical protein